MKKSVHITAEPIHSVSELLTQVAASYSPNDTILFRGQRCASWSLTPRLGRMRIRARHIADRGLAEREMLNEFKRLSVPFIAARSIANDWDLLSVAQHHGMPTRLLDWSSNPLVALWFAVEHPAEGDEPAAVWALDTDPDDYVEDSSHPLDVPRTMVFRPRHHDSRIVAQAGWFTVHKYQESSESFSDFSKLRAQVGRLRKFTFASGEFAAIRSDLARFGINRSMLFPDLGGVCDYVRWKFERLQDEDAHDIDTTF